MMNEEEIKVVGATNHSLPISQRKGAERRSGREKKSRKRGKKKKEKWVETTHVASSH